MQRDRPFSIALRLVIAGVAVVVVSTGVSLLLTHFSYQATGALDYRKGMMIAAAIPLVVSPLAYSFVAVLTARLHWANRRLDRLARHDMLTDLFNRRAFVERASAQLSQGVRQRLVMADIDHFKQINDTLGHATGDATLRHVAAALCTHAPEGSIVARIGGEEFALLIPAWRVDDAAIEHMVGHLRVAMEALDLPGIALTCSFGMAVSQDGEGLDNLLSRADKALYRAKRAGRDRLAKAA